MWTFSHTVSAAGENPHTTLPSLPILQPRTEPEGPVMPVDAEDEG